MTAQNFEKMVEEIAARFERKVGASAERLDKKVTEAFHENRIFRLVAGGTAVAVAVSVLAGAKYLMGKGYRKAAFAALCWEPPSLWERLSVQLYLGGADETKSIYP